MLHEIWQEIVFHFASVLGHVEILATREYRYRYRARKKILNFAVSSQKGNKNVNYHPSNLQDDLSTRISKP